MSKSVLVMKHQNPVVRVICEDLRLLCSIAKWSRNTLRTQVLSLTGVH